MTRGTPDKLVFDPTYFSFQIGKNGILAPFAKQIQLQIRRMKNVSSIPSESFITSIFLRWAESGYIDGYDYSPVKREVADSVDENEKILKSHYEYAEHDDGSLMVFRSAEQTRQMSTIKNESCIFFHRDWLMNAEVNMPRLIPEIQRQEFQIFEYDQRSPTDQYLEYEKLYNKHQEEREWLLANEKDLNITGSKIDSTAPRDVIISIIKEMFSHRYQEPRRFVFDNRPDCPKKKYFIECDGAKPGEDRMLHLTSVTMLSDSDKKHLPEFARFESLMSKEDRIYVDDEIDSWGMARHNKRIGLTKTPITPRIFDVNKFIGASIENKNAKLSSENRPKLYTDEDMEVIEESMNDAFQQFDPNTLYAEHSEGYFQGVLVKDLFLDNTKSIVNMTNDDIKELYKRLDALADNFAEDPLCDDVDFNPLHFIVHRHPSENKFFHTYAWDVLAEQSQKEGLKTKFVYCAPPPDQISSKVNIEQLKKDRIQSLRVNVPEYKWINTHPAIFNLFLNEKIGRMRVGELSEEIDGDIANESVKSRAVRWSKDKATIIDDEFIRKVLKGESGYRGSISKFKLNEEGMVIEDTEGDNGLSIRSILSSPQLINQFHLKKPLPISSRSKSISKNIDANDKPNLNEESTSRKSIDNGGYESDGRNSVASITLQNQRYPGLNAGNKPSSSSSESSTNIRQRIQQLMNNGELSNKNRSLVRRDSDSSIVSDKIPGMPPGGSSASESERNDYYDAISHRNQRLGFERNIFNISQDEDNFSTTSNESISTTMNLAIDSIEKKHKKKRKREVDDDEDEIDRKRKEKKHRKQKKRDENDLMKKQKKTKMTTTINNNNNQGQVYV